MNPDDVCDINDNTAKARCCLTPLSDACKHAVDIRKCPAGYFVGSEVCVFVNTLSRGEIQRIKTAKAFSDVVAFNKKELAQNNKKVLVTC